MRRPRESAASTEPAAFAYEKNNVTSETKISLLIFVWFDMYYLHTKLNMSAN